MTWSGTEVWAGDHAYLVLEGQQVLQCSVSPPLVGGGGRGSPGGRRGQPVQIHLAQTLGQNQPVVFKNL